MEEFQAAEREARDRSQARAVGTRQAIEQLAIARLCASSRTASASGRVRFTHTHGFWAYCSCIWSCNSLLSFPRWRTVRRAKLF